MVSHTMSRTVTQPATEYRENGPDTVTSLRQEPYRPQTPLAQDNVIAPYRGHLAEERPETAASDHSVSRDWSPSPACRKRGSRRPPVSFRKPLSLASLSTTSHSSAQVDHIGEEPDPLVGKRGCNGSRSSIDNTPYTPFKDLLDAQEEIRPTDFRSRVQATGVRDYGEDVADRNMCREQASDIHTIPSPLPTSKRHTPLSSTGYFVRPKPAYIKGHTLGSVLREASSLSEVGEVKTFSRRNKQRLSLNTYVPSGMKSPLTPRSANASSRMSEGVTSKGVVTRRGRPVSVGRQFSMSPTTNNLSLPRSPMSPQRTVLEWKEFLSRHGYDDIDDKFDEVRAHDSISATDPPSHLRLSSTNASQASLPRNPRRQSYQSLRSSLASSVASRPASIELTPLAWPRSRNGDVLVETKGPSQNLDVAEGRAESQCRCRKGTSSRANR